MVGKSTTSGGYDSNLTLTEKGEDAVFFTEEPELTLKRYGSSTRFEVAGALSYTNFITGNSDDQLDGGISAVYAYPIADDTFTQLNAGATWRQTTAANNSLGRRLTSQVQRANVDGRLYNNGKISVLGGIVYDQRDYASENLNRNRATTLTVGLAYVPRPLVEFSLNSVTAFSTSAPSEGGKASIRSTEQGLTFAAIGKLSPKVTSSAFAGVMFGRYRGAYRHNGSLPLAGGEIIWEANSRGAVRAELDFSSDFSPEGESITLQQVRLSYSQVVYGSWKWEVRFSPSRSQQYRETRTRRDETISVGTGLAYEPSRSFSASFDYDYTHQRSDRAFAKYDRSLIATKFIFRF